ncbi:Glyco_tran_10_N domain-containing protein [Meloidogyne graminicola]|uniref:Fucosyltransferase n=1 Tax=Meloidogyne graminicola TaxID=189291 RepID=A0A8S9ZT94_9BILA|nr:Glyco_tran_10_N domain-containing protein [Meloidogyne graminicola]
MMYTVECPAETMKYFDRKIMTDEWFNSSATYRVDSDVFMPYDGLTRIKLNTPNEYIWEQKEINISFIWRFENNICQNYVTEKFWNSLRSLTVPIVFNRSVFKGMDIPSNAFIAVDDFNSINELIEYLKALTNNTEKYLKHFEWTKTYTKRKIVYDYLPLCKICEYATKHFEQKTKSKINLNQFWNEKHCNNNFVKNFLKKNKFY